MPDRNQQPELTWTRTEAGLIPVSTRFGDPYFSLQGGLAETGHVFHAGNDLPARFRPGFHIAELGFGTGLNLLATCALWQSCDRPGALHFTSFEAFPLSAGQTATALQAFPSLATLAQPLLAALNSGQTRFPLGPVDVTLCIGDAGQTLPRWQGAADAWFLDGFAPTRNPDMWSATLMAEVARHTAPGGSFATYSAAGHVRRALQAAGFQVQRRPGFGPKRHMTVGRLHQA